MKRKQILLVTGMILGLLVLGGCGNTENQGNGTQTVESSQESSVGSTESQETSQEEESQIPDSSEEAETASQEPDGSGNAGDKQTAEGTVEVLEAIWKGFGEEERFPCYGGSISNPVDGAPGAMEVSDTDTLTYTLLIPEELQGEIQEAATMVHFMNANTFTSAALKVEQDKQAAFIDTLQDAVLHAEFMCGFPERLVVISAGDYVAYAFGEDSFVSKFEEEAQNNIEGVKVEVNQLFE